MAEQQEVDAWLDTRLTDLARSARKRMMRERELAQQLAKKYQDAAQPGRDGIGTVLVNSPHESGPYPAADVCQTPHHKIPESRRQPGLCPRRV